MLLALILTAYFYEHQEPWFLAAGICAIIWEAVIWGAEN